MSSSAYFDSTDIGSSLLGSFIEGQDYALKEVKPTGFMETGKIYEDLIEEEATGADNFSSKYFASSINNFPETKNPKLKGIFEILDGDNIAADIENGYAYAENGKLNGHYKNRHNCLNQIKAHDYRRPLPSPTWETMKLMLENFKIAQFAPPEHDWKSNVFKMISSSDVKFQQEHFWDSESGAKCRMKSDIEVFFESEGQKHGLIIDLKVTANWPSFRTNWIKKYIWQSKHYLAGFRLWCIGNGIVPPDVIWYFIQESTAPYLLHMKALSIEAIDSLSTDYEFHLNACQSWIDSGKPKRGYTDAEHVDRYLRSI